MAWARFAGLTARTVVDSFCKWAGEDFESIGKKVEGLAVAALVWMHVESSLAKLASKIVDVGVGLDTKDLVQVVLGEVISSAHLVLVLERVLYADHGDEVVSVVLDAGELEDGLHDEQLAGGSWLYNTKI